MRSWHLTVMLPSMVKPEEVDEASLLKSELLKNRSKLLYDSRPGENHHPWILQRTALAYLTCTSVVVQDAATWALTVIQTRLTTGSVAEERSLGSGYLLQVPVKTFKKSKTFYGNYPTRLTGMKIP